MGRSKKVKKRFKNGSDPEATTEKTAVSENCYENVHDVALFWKKKLHGWCFSSFTYKLFLVLAATDQTFKLFKWKYKIATLVSDLI